MKGKNVVVWVGLVVMVALMLVHGSVEARAIRIGFSGTEMPLVLIAEGEWKFLPSGNVHVRGMSTQYQEMATDPRMSGLNTSVMNANWGPDFSGPMYGTFESVIANNSDCPGGGVWRGTWTGTAYTDGSFTYYAVGKGISGCVAGLHVSLIAYNSGMGELTTFTGEILDPHGN